MASEEAWQPAVEAIDAILDEDYERAENALLQSLSDVRKERAEKRKGQ